LALAVETLERLAPNVRFPVAEVVVRLRVGGYAIGIGAGA